MKRQVPKEFTTDDLAALSIDERRRWLRISRRRYLAKKKRDSKTNDSEPPKTPATGPRKLLRGHNRR